MESFGVTDNISDNISISFSEFLWALFIIVLIVFLVALFY
jgi:hypothetical protein